MLCPISSSGYFLRNCIYRKYQNQVLTDTNVCKFYIISSHLYIHVIIVTIKTQSDSIPSKVPSCYPFMVILTTHSPFIPNPQQPLIFYPSLQLCHSESCCINRIMWYKTFGELAFFRKHSVLRSVPVLACPNNSFLLIAESYSMLWIYHSLFNHPPIEGHFLSCFEQLQIKFICGYKCPKSNGWLVWQACI